MKIEGKLLERYDTQSVSEKFKKRDFVIEYVENPLYPQFVKFQLVQDRCELLDNFQVGDEIEVTFNLRGRKWTNPQGEVVYFNSLEAWKIDKNQAAGQNIPALDVASGPEAFPVEVEDDLPF